jgi:hypothetical protein
LKKHDYLIELDLKLEYYLKTLFKNQSEEFNNLKSSKGD